MWKTILCFLSVALAFTIAQQCPERPKVVCYYSSWAIYREEIGNFNTEHIDTSLCTHLIYTFAGLNIALEIGSIDPTADITNGGYWNVTGLKQQDPCLKVILAVGGWNEGSIKYSVMVSKPESREAFVESVLRYLVYYGFDGVDVDWEYPTQRGGIQDDRANLVELLKLLHSRLSKWNLEISMAVPIVTEILDPGYDIPSIANYVNHVSLMAYDYTATNSLTTGLMAPLSAVKASTEYWIGKGFNKKNLILGLPSYARTFKLLDPEQNGVGAPTNGTGRMGEYTLEPGFFSYYELQKLLQTDLYTPEEVDGNCYAYYKDDWFTYDCMSTFEAKIDYALTTGLGGLMLWTLDTDDFRGVYDRPYTLLKAINEKLNG